MKDMNLNKLIVSEAPGCTSIPAFPLGNYMFKVNNRNTRTRCEVYSKLTIETAERRQ